MPRPIPVTVVTGFLGSGKTTLLSNLMRETPSRGLAILVNEFGEVSIDGAIFRAGGRSAALEIHELNNGLVAYGDEDQFLPTMQAILERRNRIDHVLIETSGLALPTAVMEALESPPLCADFVLDATLAVVDTPLLLEDAFESDPPMPAAHTRTVNATVADIFNRQLEFADVVVLNKIDALGEAALLEAETRVRQRAPGVRFMELAWGARLDTRLTLGLRLHQPASDPQTHHYGPVRFAPGNGAQPLPDQARLDGHAHSGLGRHAHGLLTHKHFHEHDPGWLSFVLRSREPQDAQALRSALARAAREEPVLRAKGFARVSDSQHGLLLQGVRSRVAAEWSNDAARRDTSEIVFIGYHLSRSRLAALLSEATGTRWN